MWPVTSSRTVSIANRHSGVVEITRLVACAVVEGGNPIGRTSRTCLGGRGPPHKRRVGVEPLRRLAQTTMAFVRRTSGAITNTPCPQPFPLDRLTPHPTPNGSRSTSFDEHPWPGVFISPCRCRPPSSGPLAGRWRARNPTRRPGSWTSTLWNCTTGQMSLRAFGRNWTVETACGRCDV